MLPILTLATALALGSPHRVADLRIGAGTANELVFAIDQDRAITYRYDLQAFRAVSLADVSAVKTLVSGVVNPIAAPPLIGYRGASQQIAPIDAPEKAHEFPVALQSMKCNASECLAAFSDGHSTLLGLDARPIMNVAVAGVVLAADPGGFLMVSNHHAVRVDNAGHLQIGGTFESYGPSCADFDGTSRYAVVWGETDGLRVASVGLDAEVGPAVTIARLSSVPDIDRARISFSGGRHLVAFSYTDQPLLIGAIDAIPPYRLMGVRLNSDLKPLDAAPFVINDTSWGNLLPVVAPRDGGFLVGWSHSANAIQWYDPEAAFVDLDGRVGPRILLSSGIVTQAAASAASTPDGVVVAWTEYEPQNGPPHSLRVRRFAYDGTPLDEPVVVATGAFGTSMAARGSNVLFVREGPTTVGAVLVRSDGTVQNVKLPDLTAYTKPAVAANRDGWLIVVTERGGVRGVLVDSSGNASPARTLVTEVSPDVSVTSDGDRFLLVWSTAEGFGTRICNFVPCGTRAELLDATGGTLVSGIELSSGHEPPVATFAGGEYFVVMPPSAVRISRDGAPTGDVALPTNFHQPQLVPFGDAVLAAWREDDGIHLASFVHGIAGEPAILPAADPSFALTSNAIVYSAAIDDTSAVVFRTLLNPRRRVAPR